MDIQGHRGCRGLLPENTIEAFSKAIDLGVNTLEFDAVISSDHKVIISHEPFMSHEICLTPSGEEILKEDASLHNIYKMTYEEIKSYDCGSKFHDRFPKQKKLKTHKPSLIDVVSCAESKDENILYNIEIKRKIEWDNIFHPDNKTFADLVVNEILNLNIESKTTVQCFDISTLKYIRGKYPKIKLVYLIENKETPKQNIEKLGFVPHVYSPEFKLVDTFLVDYCSQKKMKLIPLKPKRLVKST